jgi:hypothetical protein
MIVIVWAFVVIWAAVKNPDLTTLVTVITPVMVGVVGWLYADAVLGERVKKRTTTRRQAKKELPPDER